ncbi:MAG TPA: metallophosphoesterase family protein [Ktedonobacteraceae bacterium]|jgi:hypothetical protein
MQTIAPTYVIGDIHGQLKKLIYLLQQAHLIDADLSWSGGQAALWFVGDFVDRGPDGIAVVDLVMRLQKEADEAGGQVSSLLGNHEMLILAAYRFGRRSTGLGSNFISRWKRNGGIHKDIASLNQQHLEWLAALPPMAVFQDTLLMHADASFYVKYGRSVKEVNETIGKLLRRSDALSWEDLLDEFSRRGVFISSIGGTDYARRYLDIFGGKQLLHGHTPINLMRNCQPKKVTEAFVYADGLCINVDGGMFLGGPGFVYQIS